MYYQKEELERIIENFTAEDFEKSPLVIAGESKIIRYIGKGWAVTRFKPTIYSFTHNRCRVVEGSDYPRWKATKYTTSMLREHGINHVYEYFKEDGLFIFHKLLLQKPCPLLPNPFVPDDMERFEINQMGVVPPIEIIIKSFHTGTTKHSLHGMNGSRVRDDHPLFPGYKIEGNQSYPCPVVRFDWRNPLVDSEGNRLDDKALSDDQANWFIDVKETKKNSLRAYQVINEFLNTIDIVCYDLCLFFTTCGATMYGEISPDCGRFRHFNHGSLDKDVWRRGGSYEEVLEKWNLMADMIEAAWPSIRGAK